MTPNTHKLTIVTHNERLQTAAAARNFKKESFSLSDLTAKVLTGAGNFLVASGQKLQGQRQAAMPLLNVAER